MTLYQCPMNLSRAEYDRTIESAYVRWSTPDEMIEHCVMLQEAGL
jgi:hypothetical protein